MEVDTKQFSFEKFSEKVDHVFYELQLLPLQHQVEAAHLVETKLASLLASITECLADSFKLAVNSENTLLNKTTAIQANRFKADDVEKPKPSSADIDGPPWWLQYPALAKDLVPLYKQLLENKLRKDMKVERSKLPQKKRIHKLGDTDFAPRRPGRPRRESLHICTECGKVFRRPYSLREHMKCAHVGDGDKKELHQCHECGRMFKTPGGLSGHRKRYHNIGRDVYHCPHCTYATFKQDLLNIHIDRYHGPNHKQNAVCDVCGKGFTKDSQLKMHLEIHSLNKKYSCKQCKFTSHTLAGLRSHTYSQHNPNARSYQCEICSKKWRKRLYYLQHMAKHHGVHIQPFRKKKGPQPVCGDAVIREKVAVAIAAESMANLCKLPNPELHAMQGNQSVPGMTLCQLANDTLPAPGSNQVEGSEAPLPIFCVQYSDDNEQSHSTSSTLVQTSVSVSYSTPQSASYSGDPTPNDLRPIVVLSEDADSSHLANDSQNGCRQIPLVVGQFNDSQGALVSESGQQTQLANVVSEILNRITPSS